MEAIETYFLYHIQEKMLIELEDGMTIGRSRENHYPIRDELVSSRHFKVSIRDGNAFLTDLRSQNRTHINDHALSPLRKYLLSEEDKVKAGEQKFIFTRNAKANFVSADASITFSFSLNGSTEANLSMDKKPSKVLIDKPKSQSDYLSQLRQNRKNVKALEDSLTKVEESMARLEFLEETIGTKLNQVKALDQKLANTHIKSEEKFSQEIEGFDRGMQIAEGKIVEAKKTIERLQKEMAMLLEKSEETKGMFEAFQKREGARNQYDSMKSEIQELESQNLKSKRSDIVRDIRKGNMHFREIQEKYNSHVSGLGLKKSKKLSLDKKMILEKNKS